MYNFKIFLIIFSLLQTGPLAFASDVDLTSEEKSSLEKLGISRQELGEMAQKADFSEFEEKLDQAEIGSQVQGIQEHEKVEQVREKLEGARSEFEKQARQTQRELEEGAQDMAKGYAASTVSLVMLAVFAPSVVMACRTKPSALAYAGTAAVYLTRELMNSRKFKASALSEMKYVEMKLDKSKSLNSNIETAKKGLDMQFEFIQSYKNVIDKGLKSVKDKAENAKMASIGFAAASAIALGETYSLGSGTCVNIDKSSYRPGQKHHFSFWDLFLAPSVANTENDKQLEVKKKVLVKNLKDSKLADLASDSDKITAALVGAGSIAAMSFIPSYANILKKIVSNGVSRSLVFGAHSLIAYYVYKTLSDSSESLLQRSSQLQELIDKAKNTGEKGLDSLSSTLNSEELKETLEQAGLGNSEGLGEMSAEEIENAVDDIEVENIEDRVNEALEKEAIKFPSTSFLNMVFDKILPRAQAARSQKKIVLRCYIPKRCPAPRFPVFNRAPFNQMNPLLSHYQVYAKGVYQDRLDQTAKSRHFLETNNGILEKIQESLYRDLATKKPTLMEGKKARTFAQEAEREAEQTLARSLPQDLKTNQAQRVADAAEKQERAKPRDKTAVASKSLSENGTAISAADHAALTGLLERLKHSKGQLDSKQYRIQAIHSKNMNLFEVIHRRYQLIFQSQ